VPGAAPPAGSGHRPPAGLPRPGALPGPSKPPPSNGNPFGDDRRG
jgi:hypothetical protein